MSSRLDLNTTRTRAARVEQDLGVLLAKERLGELSSEGSLTDARRPDE
jgi:hypothetical protein